jgi:hypothetical protein
VIRIIDQVVADWGLFTWKQDGKFVEQVRAHLLNGMTLIISLEEFLSISDDEGW